MVWVGGSVLDLVVAQWRDHLGVTLVSGVGGGVGPVVWAVVLVRWCGRWGWPGGVCGGVGPVVSAAVSARWCGRWGWPTVWVGGAGMGATRVLVATGRMAVACA